MPRGRGRDPRNLLSCEANPTFTTELFTVESRHKKTVNITKYVAFHGIIQFIHLSEISALDHKISINSLDYDSRALSISNARM